MKDSVVETIVEQELENSQEVNKWIELGDVSIETKSSSYGVIWDGGFGKRW